MKLIHVGWITDSIKTLSYFQEKGAEMVVINTQPDFSEHTVPVLPNQIPIDFSPFIHQNRRMSLVKRILGVLTLSGSFDASVTEKWGGVDFIFANWGLNALIDAISLKSRSEFRDTPLILNLETFPTFWESGARQNFEIWALKRLWKFVDVLILPTPEMGEYLASFIPNYDKTELIMSPFWFTKSYIQNYENQSDESRDSSHPKDLVFIGQCDDGRSLNQVSESLLELAEAGIHVWYNAPMPIEHPNLHLFPYMDGADLYHGKMTAFLREFKACLVLYNHKKSPADRFQTSLPSRFLLPVQAGVPVVLPQGKYRAMENFVQQNRCGYAYKNVGELAEILRGETPFSNKSQFANTRIDEFFDRKKSKEMFNRINILS